MSDFGYAVPAYRSASEINEAMIRVYNNMFLAVLNSMVVSLLVSSSPGLMAFLFTGVMKWIVMFAPLVVILLMSFGLHKLNRQQAQLALHGFAALMGLSFATLPQQRTFPFDRPRSSKDPECHSGSPAMTDPIQG